MNMFQPWSHEHFNHLKMPQDNFDYLPKALRFVSHPLLLRDTLLAHSPFVTVAFAAF